MANIQAQKLGFFCGTAILGAMIAPVPAFAEGAAASTAQAGEGIGLEEIVVTAQKREQNLQDVPIAVTAITGDTLAANRVVNVTDLSGLAPGLVTRLSPGSIGGATFIMRGVTSFGGVGSDREISVYIDGVNIAQTRAMIFDLPDIQRIEVLRGPQGTLFGRNATAGAISIVTRDPTGEFHIKQQFSVGNYEQRRSVTTVDLPQVGPFSAYVTYQHDERRGFTRNLGAGRVSDFTGPNTGFGKVVSPEYLGDKNVNTFFAALKFKPTDDFSMVYKYSHTVNNYTPEAHATLAINPLNPTAAFILAPAFAGQALFPDGKLPNAVNNSFTGPSRTMNEGHSLVAKWDLTDSISLKNIAGYNRYKVHAFVDLGGVGGLTVSPLLAATFGAPSLAGNRFEFFAIDNQGSGWTVSNETQINYNSDFLTATVGAIYFRSNEQNGSLPNIKQNFIFSPTIPASGLIPLGGGAIGYQKGSSLAGYAQFEFHLTHQLDVVAGYRLTKDKKTGSFVFGGTFNPSSPGARTGTITGEQSLPFVFAKTKPNYAIGVNFRPTNDFLVYGKYSTAFMSGGAISAISFPPESVRSWEGGVKADLFDRRLRTNLALWDAKYTNLQKPGTGSSIGRPELASVVVNGGTLKAHGAEFELTAAVTNGLTAGGSAAYTKSTLSNPFPALVTGAGGAYVQTSSPKWTTTVWGQYETQPLFAETVALFRIDGAWTAKMRVDPNPNIATIAPAFAPYEFQKAAWNWNARVALKNIQAGPAKAELAFWVRNLGNNRDFNSVTALPLIAYTTGYNDPRTFGLDLTIEF
jgi:iron complex outermembrane receptor protein